MGSFGDIDPGAIACARNEDSERLIRMDASRPEEWSNHDMDLITGRLMTTIRSEKIVPRLLPEFLKRVIREPYAGWTTSGDVVLQKLEMSHFATWGQADREAVLALLPLYLATPETDSESLAVWLDAFSRKDT